MKTTDYIRDRINKFPRGYVFTYKDFITEVNRKEAIIKFLNRLVASNRIEKLAKGRYYKPQETIFGILLPEQNQIVKDLLEKDGKLRGYISGNTFFNYAGFTTQISNTIQIAHNDMSDTLQRGQFRITFFKQKNTITASNIPLLRILDVMRFIKRIPDSSFQLSITRLNSLISELSEKEQLSLIQLSYKYYPSVRALLGALLENMELDELEIGLEKLKTSLNPITKYKIGISEKILPTISNWNIL